MNRQHILTLSIATAAVLIVGSSLVAQDRSLATSPNGISLAEFNGYDSWRVIAPSATSSGVKVIVGNATMIKAYNDGAPVNGTLIPDGAMMAKIEWAKKSNPASPYEVAVPATLKSLSFMMKDTRRFPDTAGWGYAQFAYDGLSDTFKPFGDGPTFAKTVCHECHTRVKVRDFVFTTYARR